MPRRALGPAALVAAVTITTWLVSGVAALNIVWFTGYEIAFAALPGAALLWAVRGRRPDFVQAIAIGWPLGQALEVFAFTATAAVGVRAAFAVYPLAVFAVCAAVLRRRLTAFRIAPGAEPMSCAALWATASATSIGLAYLALLFLPQVPLPSSTTSVAYNPDFVFFIGLAGQALHHWPLTSPGLAGVPLHYESFVFFHIAAVSQVTGLAISTIALRLDYVPTMIVLAIQLLALGRLIGASAWTGVVAIAVFFLLGPLDLTTDVGGAPFGGFIYRLSASWTLPFGLMFLLALLYLISAQMQSRTWRARGDIRAMSLMAILMAGASGTKATVLPVLICGMGLYVLVRVVVRRPVPRQALVTLGLGVAVFATTFLVVYGGGVPGTSIDPFVSFGRTLPMLAAQGVADPTLRHLLLPFAYVAGIAGALLPLAGTLYLFRRRHRTDLARYAPCMCVFAAGLLITNVVHQVGYSELYFLDTGYAAGCVAAAGGLRLAWADGRRMLPVSSRSLGTAFALWVVALVALVAVTSRVLAHTDAVVIRYVALAVVAIIFVYASRRLLRPAGSGHRLVVVALGLIPLMAASALAYPLLVAHTAKRVITDSLVTVEQPDPQTVWGLTPGLLVALVWLEDHSPSDAVFAVNNHWINPAKSDAREYYYSAFSEREVFVEAYDPIRFGISASDITPAEVNFTQRRRLNDAVFDQASAAALTVLIEQYKVRFLFIDRMHGSIDPAVLGLGRVVFTNPAATILAVG